MLTSSPSSSSTNNTSSFNKDEIEKQIEEWKNKYLNKYICSISQQLMIDPVIISETGQTYDRKEIEEWLQKQNTCPTTGIILKSKLLTPNYFAKSAMNENVGKFIKKVVKNVKLWCSDVNLIEICSELINESLDLVKNNNNFNSLQNDLNMLQFDILLNNQNIEEQVLFDKYIKLVKELPNLNDKIVQLQKLENKLTNEAFLQQFFFELLNLLIELKNDSNINLLIEVFTKYCKLNNVDSNLFDNILDCIQDNEMKLNCIILLFNNTNYSRNILLEILLNIEIDKFNEEFINFFKDLLKEVNLNEIDHDDLIIFFENCNELKEEQIIIFEKLFKNTNEVKYLESLYELDNNNKDLELQLLSEYLKLNLMDKYLNLYIKLNEDKLDSFNIIFLKYLQNQNNKIENQNKEIIILQNENLKLKNKFNNLENSLLYCNNLKEWKNQQIINNFKIKYPEYNYVNIINIETPLNIKKEERFSSNEFEVFGLKWKICIYPKGNSNSKENKCAIYLHLKSLQYKNENEEEKEISSIKIKYSINNINLNNNKNYEFNFTKIEGRGNYGFKQSNFIPIIKNDKQIFSVVIGMKKLEIKFK
ncbi:hypothetical protein ABK040_011417 [Willaertia magna]